MSGEQAARLLEALREESPTALTLALGAAAQAFKLRPQFLRRQPRERQAEWARRALSRAASADAAEEVLAEFFLGCRRALLVEWLDALGLEHDDGSLAAPHPPCPDSETLVPALEKFRAGEPAEERDLLVRAFAAQTAVDWPRLEALL
ncbi:MAG: hypothetical protein ACE5IL_07455 [Myxococcota bacterium]